MAVGAVKACDVKEALRRRHPWNAQGSMPGQWTCLEEWHDIDLIAFSAWADGGVRGCRYPVVGYEVKVSRADYKRELHDPSKRAGAVAFCNAFYFAVPFGLLKADEIAFDAPAWTFDDFQRPRCDAGCYRQRGQRGSGEYVEIPRDPSHPSYREDYAWTHHDREWRICQACGGTGASAPSTAEIDSPVSLWVPPDVGLLIVNEAGRNTVAKPAPIRKGARSPAGKALADLIRWASYRPDPRHVRTAA